MAEEQAGRSDDARATAEPDSSSARRSEPVGEGAPLTEARGDGAELEQGAEKDIWTGRTHWKHYAGRLLLWLLGCTAAAVLLAMLASRTEGLTAARAFWIFLALFVLSGALIVGKVLLIVLGQRYRLTSQRLFIERGILSRTIDQTELIRVDDVRMYKSLMDRIFGLGTVSVMSTDATDRQVLIEGIADPEPVAEAIRTNMRSMRRKSLFVENL